MTMIRFAPVAILVVAAACFTSPVRADGTLTQVREAAKRGGETNNLQQIGLDDFGFVREATQRNQEPNNLKQIGLALHNFTGTYIGDDGSVHNIADDGSVRYILPFIDSGVALCFRNVGIPGTIKDGNSNTIAFSESSGLRVTSGLVTGLAPIMTVLDGTSNTIGFNESTTSACLGNVQVGDILTGNVTDGASNTILFGGGSSFDLCFSHAYVASVADGTSNTLLPGNAWNNVCSTDIGVGGDFTVVSAAVSEPASLALMIPVLGFFFVPRADRRRRDMT